MSSIGSRKRGRIGGQIAVEFMLVAPFFFLFFAIIVELAVYCVNGQLFLLNSFYAARTAEVRSELVRFNNSQSSTSWKIGDRLLINNVIRQMPNSTLATVGVPDAQGGPDRPDGGFRRPRTGTLRERHNYQPLTSSLFLNQVPMTGFRGQPFNLILQSQYQKDLNQSRSVGDNCLPGILCAPRCQPIGRCQ